MSYSNSGPVVAAYVVEKIAGQPFEEFVRQNLFEPLAMETADFFLTTAVEARLAKSYKADGVSEIPYSHIIMRPSGAISATPRDMAHFATEIHCTNGDPSDDARRTPGDTSRIWIGQLHGS